MKKLVALVLSVILMLSALPLNVFAMDGNSINVEVRENPIQEISIDDFNIIKSNYDDTRYTNGTDYVVYGLSGYSLLNDYNRSCKVTYQDQSTEIVYDNSSSEKLGNTYFTTTCAISPDTWESGNTYEITATLLGVSTTFNVTVLEIESIEIEDVEIVENTKGFKYEGKYIYDYYSPVFSVTFTDGTVKSGLMDCIDIDNENYWLYIDDSEQYSNPWTVGNTYEVTGTLMGVTDTFTVTIKESPVESLSISDISIVENTNGYIETGFEESYYHYCYFYPDFSVTLKNGDIINSNGSSVEIGGEWYSIAGNMWELQQEQTWTVGNTYQVTGTLLGVSDTFSVTIIEIPIESIEIQDVSIIEYSDGYFEGENYYYTPSLTATVTYKDGTTKECWGSLEINGNWYSIADNMLDLQQEQAWTVGNTYQVTGTLLGVSDTFSVTIIETPIQSIEIQDVSIIEYTNGQSYGENYHYSMPSLTATVTYKDGTTKEHIGALAIGGKYYGISDNMWELQQEQVWTVGNTYQVTGTLLGVSDTFSVTIIETPIQSVVLEDIVLIKGVDSSNHDGDYEYYYYSPTLSEATLKDGTKAEIVDDYKIIYNGEYYYPVDNSWELQQEQPWIVGNTYKVEVIILGYKATLNVTIAENPIQELEIVKLPDKTEYLTGEYFNLKGSIIKIKYNDGSSENIIIEEDYTVDLFRSVFSEKFQKYSSITFPSNCFDIEGEQKIELQLFGKICEFPVVVKRNLIESISIRENYDKSLTITVNNSDNTSYDMILLDVCEHYSQDDDRSYTSIFTDKGVFDAVIFDDETNFSIGLSNGYDGNIIKSNNLFYSEWYEILKRADNYIYRITADYNIGLIQFKHFAGKITADNIDDIIQIAIELSNAEGDFYAPPSSSEAYVIYAGETVQKAVRDIFGIENIDLTLSKEYDAENNTCKVEYVGIGGGGKSAPFKISYSNGVWEIEGCYDNETTISLRFNNNQQIIGFDITPQYIIGDIDGIEGVSDSDAEYLLMHTFFPEDYPLNQECDFNGDGYVNDADAEHLLMFTFFPEDYPLN